MSALFHYTDKSGFNAIGSQPTWLFKAAQPPCAHEFGAYFTPLPETTPLLARKLRIGKEKVKYVFSFRDVGDLNKKIDGDRGEFVFFSPEDYPVAPDRQIEKRLTQLVGLHGEKK